MNGKKGSIAIDVIDNLTTPNKSESNVRDSSTRRWVKWMHKVYEFGKEDTSRVTFSLKVGLAVLLASLLILFQKPYDEFGLTNLFWCVLTVVLVFEYTVGATFCRGFNRAIGSVVAGIFALVVIQVAVPFGHVAEPCVIGFSIFFIGAVTSFVKLWPSLVTYEYGFRVILITFSLLIVSVYRMGNPFTTTIDRFCSIAIGGFVALFVNIFVFPIWAGDQLHKELVTCFNSVADSLEECVKKYLNDDGSSSDHPEFAKTVNDDFSDEPAYKKCRATLNSSATLDSLANSAKWEPPHGRFRHLFYPWSAYVKVGAVLRHCAYQVMALHGCLHSQIQAPYKLRSMFQPEILDAANHAAELIRSLAKDIQNMNHNLHANLLKRVHSSTDRLQHCIDMHSNLLTNIHEEPYESFNLKDSKSYHNTMKKQQKRLCSWPSREVDEFNEDAEFIMKMRALESTTTLSLATFASLLIEFVARLDHLVDAVDGLAKIAKFKEEHKG